MYSSVEKLLSLFANFVSVIGFALSLLSVMGFDPAQIKPAQNQRMAVALIAAFSFASSYAIANFLIAIRTAGKQTAIPWFLSVWLYSTTFWYLLDIGVTLNSPGNSPNPLLGVSGKALALWLFAYGINLATMYKIYFWRLVYPNGYSIEEHFSLNAESARNSMSSIGAMVAHVVMLSIFMVLLGP